MYVVTTVYGPASRHKGCKAAAGDGEVCRHKSCWDHETCDELAYCVEECEMVMMMVDPECQVFEDCSRSEDFGRDDAAGACCSWAVCAGDYDVLHHV
jgi:hypothetical protein